MALITTLSADDADCYVTLDEAKAYLADNATFIALTDAAMETLLKKATMQIDSLRFHGELADDDQALKFPRIINDHLGDTVEQEEIPTRVKYATMEQAAHILKGAGERRAQMQADGVTSAKVGDVAETYDGSGASQLSYSATARGFLKGFVSRIGRITNY